MKTAAAAVGHAARLTWRLVLAVGLVAALTAGLAVMVRSAFS